MKKILLTLIAVAAYFAVDAQYYYFFEDNSTNPGSVNTETTEFPVGGGIGAGWSTIIGTSNSTPTLSASQSIPFAFSFNGGTVTSYKAISNGSISFASNPTAPTSYATVTLPSSTMPDSSVIISGIQGSGGSDNVVTKTFGTAPNRQHWIHFSSYTPTSTLASSWSYWAIVLEETTNKIYIVDMRSNAVYSGINVGIQINSTTAITKAGHATLSSNDPTPDDNRYYEFIPGTQPAYDMAAKTSTVSDIVVLSNAPFSITGTIQNRGSATVTSYDLNYKVGTGSTVTSGITGASIANGAVDNFSHPTTWTPAAIGTYTIEAWATNINGNPDANTADDKVTFTVDVVDTIIPRKTLMEVFTSSTCGPCTAGNQNMDNVVVPSLTAGTYTIIKYQQNFPGAGDPYSTATSVARRGFYGVNSIPRMEIDGQWDVNANSLTKAVVESFQNEPSFVAIDILGARIAGPVVAIEADITPYANLTGNLKYHVVITEKETDQNTGTNGETEFYHVMMDMLPNQNGSNLTSLSSGNPTNIRLVSSFDDGNVEGINDLKVVIFVQDMTSKKILQSEWMDIALSSVGVEENEVTSTLNVFPNPSNGNVTIDYASTQQSDLTISVVNTLGATVYSSTIAGTNGTLNQNIDLSHLTKGIYMVNVASENSVTTKKLIIQ